MQGGAYSGTMDRTMLKLAVVLTMGAGPSAPTMAIRYLSMRITRVARVRMLKMIWS